VAVRRRFLFPDVGGDGDLVERMKPSSKVCDAPRRKKTEKFEEQTTIDAPMIFIGRSG
jgi:hypothetical protein